MQNSSTDHENTATVLPLSIILVAVIVMIVVAIITTPAKAGNDEIITITPIVGGKVVVPVETLDNTAGQEKFEMVVNTMLTNICPNCEQKLPGLGKAVQATLAEAGDSWRFKYFMRNMAQQEKRTLSLQFWKESGELSFRLMIDGEEHDSGLVPKMVRVEDGKNAVNLLSELKLKEGSA